MVNYYDLILLFPLVMIVVLKVFGLISTEIAVVYWVSFLFSSIVYAAYKEGAYAVISLLISVVFIKMLIKLFSKIKTKMSSKNVVECISLFSENNKAIFFDGRKTFEKHIDFDQVIIPGKIYIIRKNN